MAAFSTLALIAGGLLGGAAIKKATSGGSDVNKRTLAPGPTATTIGRARPADSPVIGQAIPRDSTGATSPASKTAPDATKASSDSIAAANAAAQKARRRGANQSLLTGAPLTGRSPKFPPKSLIGY